MCWRLRLLAAVVALCVGLGGVLSAHATPVTKADAVFKPPRKLFLSPTLLPARGADNGAMAEEPRVMVLLTPRTYRVYQHNRESRVELGELVALPSPTSSMQRNQARATAADGGTDSVLGNGVAGVRPTARLPVKRRGVRRQEAVGERVTTSQSEVAPSWVALRRFAHNVYQPPLTASLLPDGQCATRFFVEDSRVSESVCKEHIPLAVPRNQTVGRYTASLAGGERQAALLPETCVSVTSNLGFQHFHFPINECTRLAALLLSDLPYNISCLHVHTISRFTTQWLELVLGAERLSRTRVFQRHMCTSSPLVVPLGGQCYDAGEYGVRSLGHLVRTNLGLPPLRYPPRSGSQSQQQPQPQPPQQPQQRPPHQQQQQQQQQQQRQLGGGAESEREPEQPTVLVLRRDPTQKRMVTNQEEMLEVVREAVLPGVRVEVYDADAGYTLREIAHMFARAGLIVAPHGAGLANLVATVPFHCTVVEFTRHNGQPAFALMAQQMGHLYVGISEYTVRSHPDFPMEHFRVQLDHLRAVFDDLATLSASGFLVSPGLHLLRGASSP
jgi:Glycosyltransferase 61